MNLLEIECKSKRYFLILNSIQKFLTDFGRLTRIIFFPKKSVAKSHYIICLKIKDNLVKFAANKRTPYL